MLFYTSILNSICIYSFKCTYSITQDILIILLRRTTNITNSKHVHLNTHTARADHVQSIHFVRVNDMDVLYLVSRTTSSEWKHRNYNAARFPVVCISALVTWIVKEGFICLWGNTANLFRGDYIIETFLIFLFLHITSMDGISVLSTILYLYHRNLVHFCHLLTHRDGGENGKRMWF